MGFGFSRSLHNAFHGSFFATFGLLANSNLSYERGLDYKAEIWWKLFSCLKNHTYCNIFTWWLFLFEWLVILFSVCSPFHVDKGFTKA